MCALPRVSRQLVGAAQHGRLGSGLWASGRLGRGGARAHTHTHTLTAERPRVQRRQTHCNATFLQLKNKQEEYSDTTLSS